MTLAKGPLALTLWSADGEVLAESRDPWLIAAVEAGVEYRLQVARLGPESGQLHVRAGPQAALRGQVGPVPGNSFSLQLEPGQERVLAMRAPGADRVLVHAAGGDPALDTYTSAGLPVQRMDDLVPGEGGVLGARQVLDLGPDGVGAFAVSSHTGGATRLQVTLWSAVRQQVGVRRGGIQAPMTAAAGGQAWVGLTPALAGASLFTVRLEGTTSAVLEVFDEEGQPLAVARDEVRFGARPGQTFYLRVSTGAGQAGRWEATIEEAPQQ
jgi:hypothetical protein